MFLFGNNRITQDKRSATVVATVACTVMLIPTDQFLSLMQSDPKIAHSLIERMARRIDLLNKEVTPLRMPSPLARRSHYLGRNFYFSSAVD